MADHAAKKKGELRPRCGRPDQGIHRLSLRACYIPTREGGSSSEPARLLTPSPFFISLLRGTPQPLPHTQPTLSIPRLVTIRMQCYDQNAMNSLGQKQPSHSYKQYARMTFGSFDLPTFRTPLHVSQDLKPDRNATIGICSATIRMR